MLGLLLKSEVFSKSPQIEKIPVSIDWQMIHILDPAMPIPSMDEYFDYLFKSRIDLERNME